MSSQQKRQQHVDNNTLFYTILETMHPEIFLHLNRSCILQLGMSNKRLAFFVKHHIIPQLFKKFSNTVKLNMNMLLNPYIIDVELFICLSAPFDHPMSPYGVFNILRHLRPSRLIITIISLENLLKYPTIYDNMQLMTFINEKQKETSMRKKRMFLDVSESSFTNVVSTIEPRHYHLYTNQTTKIASFALINQEIFDPFDIHYDTGWDRSGENPDKNLETMQFVQTNSSFVRCINDDRSSSESMRTTDTTIATEEKDDRANNQNPNSSDGLTINEDSAIAEDSKSRFNANPSIRKLLKCLSGSRFSQTITRGKIDIAELMLANSDVEFLTNTKDLSALNNFCLNKLLWICVSPTVVYFELRNRIAKTSSEFSSEQIKCLIDDTPIFCIDEVMNRISAQLIPLEHERIQHGDITDVRVQFVDVMFHSMKGNHHASTIHKYEDYATFPINDPPRTISCNCDTYYTSTMTNIFFINCIMLQNTYILPFYRSGWAVRMLDDVLHEEKQRYEIMAVYFETTNCHRICEINDGANIYNCDVLNNMNYERSRLLCFSCRNPSDPEKRIEEPYITKMFENIAIFCRPEYIYMSGCKITLMNGIRHDCGLNLNKKTINTFTPFTKLVYYVEKISRAEKLYVPCLCTNMYYHESKNDFDGQESADVFASMNIKIMLSYVKNIYMFANIKDWPLAPGELFSHLLL